MNYEIGIKVKHIKSDCIYNICPGLLLFEETDLVDCIYSPKIKDKLIYSIVKKETTFNIMSLI